MGKVVTNGTIEIGYECFEKIRKKPCLCVREGNEVHVLGTLIGKEEAEFFVDKLAEMVGAKEGE